jgi:hypothetical protein
MVFNPRNICLQAAATNKYQQDSPVVRFDEYNTRTLKLLNLRARCKNQHGMPPVKNS